MSLKTKNIIRVLVKISILSLIIYTLIHYGAGFFNKQKETNLKEEQKTENIENFKNVKITPIANVWVAISTNIWIKHTSKQNIDYSNIYKEVFSIDDILKDTKTVKEEIIWKNMLFLKEYFNFIKLDFNNILTNASDKKSSLENIINQLELRFTQSITNSNYLKEQNTIIEKEYNSVLQDIENIKQDMFNNYNSTNTENIYNDINSYYSLKSKETKLKLYLVFINNFLSNYNSINNYNKLLLDTLINNKDIITKWSYVVIPDSWDDLIWNFGLIISESDYKTKKED